MLVGNVHMAVQGAVTVGGLWAVLFRGLCAPNGELAPGYLAPSPSIGALPVVSVVGQACVGAMVATAGYLAQLQPHPSVTMPVLQALNAHCGILLHG